MKDFLKRIKADYLLSSLLCIALGIVFIVWKDSILDMLGSFFAAILIIIGVAYLSSYFLQIVSNGLSVIMGIVVLAVGLWFLIKPSFIVSLIPIMIGVVLGFHGIRGIMESVHTKNLESNKWVSGFVMAMINLALGIICIVDAFGVMEKATVIVGVFLIYNGVSNIWISFCSTKAESSYNKAHPLDVEFVEDKSDHLD